MERRKVEGVSSENVLGNLSPGTKILSTPSSMMMAILIVPPDEPSLDMASAKAVVPSSHRQYSHESKDQNEERRESGTGWREGG